ncbi:M64 family metallopeptidase, partial [Sulfurimonas sp. RIFOXYB12_FULL_35_9]|uniref:M64 family metallopeptidase n=1 Tax=Sulfurimonas sp. RIFOXYB12_FULL_35_9 TaxID=1802256 RepID=UPI0025D70268
VNLKVYSRKWEGDFVLAYETTINPTDYFINPETKNFSFKKLVDNGDPANNVDLVFLAEGYTLAEMDKFENDVRKMTNYLFLQEPFKSTAKKFNIWIVNSPSDESGTDIPGEGVYRKTIMNSSFYTFDSDRYLTTPDVKSVRDIAGIVPYDDICIIVNTDKYGGGGVFNHYAIFSANHLLSEKVFIHEFGHSFAGLGDEYYNS